MQQLLGHVEYATIIGTYLIIDWPACSFNLTHNSKYKSCSSRLAGLLLTTLYQTEAQPTCSVIKTLVR